MRINVEVEWQNRPARFAHAPERYDLFMDACPRVGELLLLDRTPEEVELVVTRVMHQFQGNSHRVLVDAVMRDDGA